MDVDKFFADRLANDLPAKVRKSTTQIRELDVKCNGLTKNIHKTLFAFANGMNKMTREQKKHHIAEIDRMYAKAEKMARAKVALSTELYDDVDHDILMMDKITK
ncbi:hypothetical protein PENTCL1PPCAC_26323, partial [Pristionchus entomophagus]